MEQFNKLTTSIYHRLVKSTFILEANYITNVIYPHAHIREFRNSSSNLFTVEENASREIYVRWELNIYIRAKDESRWLRQENKERIFKREFRGSS